MRWVRVSASRIWQSMERQNDYQQQQQLLTWLVAVCLSLLGSSSVYHTIIVILK